MAIMISLKLQDIYRRAKHYAINEILPLNLIESQKIIYELNCDASIYCWKF